MFEPIYEMIKFAVPVLFVMMFLLWVLHLKIKNAGVVDIGWTLGLVILAITYILKTDGYFPRQLILLGMIIVWGTRLSFHLVKRFLNEKREDPRYQKIRARWKTNTNLKFFFFFQFQALLDVILSFPFLVIAMNPAPRIAAIEWAGIVIWLIGLVGETGADDQLRNFRGNPANQGKVCRVGLWNYSRHPNYFFEWLMWVGYFIFSLGFPEAWFSIVSPLLMLYFLLKVSGVPLAEEQSLQSRGDLYREYQRTTSIFVPWLKKKT